MRPVEAASLGAFSSHAAQVLPRVRELLDAVIRGTDPDPVLPVHAQCDGPARARFTVQWGPEPAGLGILRPPERQELPRRGELLDAIERRVGRNRDTEAMAACDAPLKAVADYDDAPRDEGCRPWTASLSSRDGDVKVILTEGLDPIATAWPAKKYSKDLAPPRRSW